MDLVELEEKSTVSREDAAARLCAIADELAVNLVSASREHDGRARHRIDPHHAGSEASIGSQRLSVRAKRTSAADQDASASYISRLSIQRSIASARNRM